MARKAYFLFQYSGLPLIFLVAQCIAAVLSDQLLHLSLFPSEPKLVKHANSSTMVTCAPSSGELKVRWINPHGRTVSHVVTQRVHVERKGNGSLALVLGSVNPGDAGTWSCDSGSDSGVLKQTFTLHVIQDTHFADTPIVQEGVEGTTGTIRCEAHGDPPPKIHWNHNGKPIPESSKKYRKLGDGLSINELRRSDSGEYTCAAYQVSPVISSVKSRVIRFNVLHRPIFINQRNLYYGYLYGKSELTCDVLADPPATIKWISKPVPQDYFRVHNDTINSSTLEISVGDPVVMGKYTCNARNAFGVVEEVFELRYGTKPISPKRFIIKEATNTSVSVEVEQEDNPQNNSTEEADLVSGYRFQYISISNYRRYRQMKTDNLWFAQGEANRNVSENNLYLIGGLMPNTIYKIRVATLNQAGPSEFTKDREFATSGCLARRVTVTFWGLMIVLITLSY